MTTPEQTRWKVVQQYEDEMQRLPSGSKPKMIDVAKAVVSAGRLLHVG
jgi:hypothetical protein